ncbi:MAG: DNA translocase FtsK [Clostridiales bacterium]|nr:DNA translocase FtsK [Clostridiales bacterium]
MTQKKQPQRKRTPAYSTDAMVVHLIFGLLLIALGVMIFLANTLGMTGDVFDGLRQFSRGMCGLIAHVLPVLPIWGGVLLMIAIQRKPSVRSYLLSILMLVLLCAAATLTTFVGTSSMPDYFRAAIAQMGVADTLPAYLTRAFDFGARRFSGGGLVGMLLAWPLWKGVGAVPGAIIVVLGAVVNFFFLIKLDVRSLWAQGQRRKEERRSRQQAAEAQQRQQELMWQQEQMRIQQEQRRMRETMRQQQIAQQLQEQQLQQSAPVYQSYQPMSSPEPGVPLVRQVQPRGQQQPPARQHGFQPTPEELGQVSDAPQPMPQPGKKKRGGLFGRDKGEETPPRKRSLFGDEPEEEAPEAMPAMEMEPPVGRVKPARAASRPQTQPSFSAEEETPPRRRSVYQRPEPEPDLDEPEFTFTEEPQIFTPAEEPVPPPAARPAAPARTETARPATAVASTPVAPPPQKPAPVEESEDMPERDNSFLARLRAAKKAAGLEVPDEPDSPSAPAKTAPPRPAARMAQPDEDDWANTPPWEDAPAPNPSSTPMRPVVAQKKPEGGYEPELNLKPRRSGSDLPEPMFTEHQEVPYVFPSMDLLKTPEPQHGISPEEDAARSLRLENTLQSFRVPAKVRHITHGPAISRFELEIAAGIKVSKVTDLKHDIAMNMEVKSVRIEAPIPGKPLVGVEVPNKQRATVTLREVLESEPMRKAKEPLVVALGRDIAGTPIVCDLAKMPHLLIAGATGSGKSVCINTIINSLLYRCSPQEVRLILVDPKVVELQCYNGIPHLLIPVVSDPHKASGALAWAVGEMMDRYKRFQEAGVRNINGFNENADKDARMPRIVIVIDELADLMMTCKKDVEERICRLAQLARAAGIHLIVATQRPSVDVITGLIKANIPSRIAFKVSASVDSRTILDRVGAEQLLGYGDMLYMPTGEFTPIRVQGCFLSDPEVNRITDFIRENCPSDYDPAVLDELERLQSESEGGGSSLPEMPAADDYVGGDGSLLTQCIEMAVQDGQVSTSLIQRRLRLGYARAGRLVDEMEKRGIVGPKDGAKPRMCLISREEFEAMKATGELD